ncbi:hypothetical protein [Rhodopirellula sp. MGV]|uniref:hypothetical protein n=1 Tax=Rhodopirellula sp. MGV TaxID=2023130 RepID=UPI000B9747DC|nr:hypothetical protein [Rhodopirellula sp. MGV]OYP28857.1 hypothetical protein CGZ80_25090 [Rhodopirellula sp. MGV]PNY37030.1 hypothetical protein C2E31_10520 [Rhodopirellula baltica]
MDQRDLDRMPNPFSPFAEESKRSRETVTSTVKWLLIAVVMFVAVTYAQTRLEKFRVAVIDDQLASNASGDGQLDAEGEQSALRKIDQIENDHDKVDLLIHALCCEDIALSKESAGRLFELNSQWTTIPVARQIERRSYLARKLTSALTEHLAMSQSEHVCLHARQVARAIFEDLVESPDGLSDENDAARLTAMKAVSVLLETQLTEKPMAIASHPESMVAKTDASWTDWPPAPPKIYRKQVASLKSVEQPAVVLSQLGESEANQPEPRLVRPTMQTSSTPSTIHAINEGSQESDSIRSPEQIQIQRYVDLLASRSRWDRLEAVASLAKLNTPQVVQILRRHVEGEQDLKVANLIRNYLDEDAR